MGGTVSLVCSDLFLLKGRAVSGQLGTKRLFFTSERCTLWPHVSKTGEVPMTSFQFKNDATAIACTEKLI